MKVYGPYVHTTGRLKGRRYLTIINDDGTKTSMLYSRYLMEQHLGRKLSSAEHVDHIDDDFTNDSIENLQILSVSENVKKDHLRRPDKEILDLVCVGCGASFTREGRRERGNRKQGKTGPYCTRGCVARHKGRMA